MCDDRTNQVTQDECVREFEHWLPGIRQFVRYGVRRWWRKDMQEDAEAEALSASWEEWRRLWQRGLDPAPLVKSIAWYAVAEARSAFRRQTDHIQMSGRGRVPGGEQLAPRPERCHQGARPGLLADLLADFSAEPAAAAGLRIDLETFYGTLPERWRGILEAWGMGYGAKEIAEDLGVSPCTAYQVRYLARERWEGAKEDW